jgi:hypothetical protein
MYGMGWVRTFLGPSCSVPYWTAGQDRQCIVMYGMGWVRTFLGPSCSVPYWTAGQDRQVLGQSCWYRTAGQDRQSRIPTEFQTS